jgi:hypothetical protein
MAKGRQIKTDERGIIGFTAYSGVDRATSRPVVRIEVGEQYTHITPEAARALAMNLLQCAEAAETDSYVLRFFREQLGLEDEAAHMLMHQMRGKRSARQGKEANSA